MMKRKFELVVELHFKLYALSLRRKYYKLANNIINEIRGMTYLASSMEILTDAERVRLMNYCHYAEMLVFRCEHINRK